MKRVLCICFAILSVFAFHIPVQAAGDSSMPTKTVNVVYDDSGSMYSQDVDTWCQAKYSMEVFAAMLGDNDTMNVYYMSDFEKNTSAGPRIVLNGKEGAAANVEKIHDQKTTAGNTPFNSVRKAYADLEGASSDEKWLVILTDGEFQGIEGTQGIDDFFADKSENIKIMFLGMGADAGAITEKQDNNIFYLKASTSHQILESVTDICTRVFDYNKLKVDASTKKFDFDVPMGELIVFAQGANVDLKGIKNANNALFKSSTEPVEVKYSECDATNYTNKPSKDLLGKIATYRDDFVSDKYSVDVSGAETIEIYYKPNIEVAAYLKDSKGNDVTDISNLAAGDYTISFGFVKAGTKEKVADSELLGDVTYKADVTNNGVDLGDTYSDGDSIKLDEGTLSIDVTAKYLEYNSITTHLDYDIFRDKDVTLSVKDNPEYTITSDGLDKDEPIRIEAKIDGKDFTDEQWKTIEAPKIQLTDKDRDFIIDFSEIKKTDKIGEFEVTPILPKGKPSTGTYKDVAYNIVFQQKCGNSTWKGNAKGTLKLKDTRSWWERNWDLFVKLMVWLIVFIILWGYMPFVKHYLPKSLKSRPYIKCIPSEPGEKRKDRNGSVDKSIISTIIPYVPQKGTIKYVPKGVIGCPPMAVKAIRHRRMALTNMKAYIGKDYITFDGETIKKDEKRFETGAGVNIRVKHGGWTYDCSPNQSN